MSELLPKPASSNDLQVFDSLAAEVTTILEPLKNVTVDSAEKRELAMTSGRKVKELLERFNEQRLAITRPLDDRKKAVMAHVNQVTLPLEQAKTALAGKIAAFDDAERRRLKAEQDRIEAENRKRQQELDRIEAETRKLTEEDPLGLFTEDAQETQAVVARERFQANAQADIQSRALTNAAPLKGSSLVWTMEVVDAALVPREYLVVNEVALRQAFRANSSLKVPGVRYYQKSQASFR